MQLAGLGDGDCLLVGVNHEHQIRHCAHVLDAAERALELVLLAGELQQLLLGEAMGLASEQLLELTRDRDKLERALGGIKEMAGLPDILFIIDTNKEAIAVQEANKLKIPVIAVLDSNSSPNGIAFPVPGNDDAMRAIHLYCELVSGAVLEGLQAELAASGADIGARAEVPPEVVPEAAPEDRPTA